MIQVSASEKDLPVIGGDFQTHFVAFSEYMNFITGNFNKKTLCSPLKKKQEKSSEKYCDFVDL